MILLVGCCAPEAEALSPVSEPTPRLATESVARPFAGAQAWLAFRALTLHDIEQETRYDRFAAQAYHDGRGHPRCKRHLLTHRRCEQTDHYLIEQMANFNRERIPERQPHAKGHGAFGYFEVTNDVSAFTRAAVFQPGIRTDTLIRFSTVAGERGSADSWRDPRGFALKFYTSEGNSGADDEVEHVLGTAQLEPVPRLGHSVAAGRLGGCPLVRASVERSARSCC